MKQKGTKKGLKMDQSGSKQGPNKVQKQTKKGLKITKKWPKNRTKMKTFNKIELTQFIKKNHQ